MKKEKKPLSVLTKSKLIYSGELGLFAIVFVVLSVLILVGKIPMSNWKRIAFSYVVLAASLWAVADFIWTLASKKRRAKKCMLDKCLALPAALFAITFDIIAFINGWVHSDEIPEIYPIIIGSFLAYHAVNFGFQAIYHWFHPLPEIYEAAAEAEEEIAKAEEEEKAQAEAKVEEEQKPVEEPVNNQNTQQE